MSTHQPIDLIPLERIINRSPLTVTAKMLVMDAITLLNEAQADCVLVVENQQLVGIFTAQDVVRLVATGKDLASLKMFEVMTKQIITLTPSHSQNAIAEEALKESKQQYVTLAQASPVGIFRTDLEGHCLYVNERWCQITGLSQIEARKDGWEQALHPGDRQRVFEEWDQSAQQNLPFKSEYRFQRADGIITWVFGQAVKERGIDDELIGYVGTITDISEVKRAEEALRQYELIVSAMPDGVALVNRDYTFRLINQTYLSLHEKGYNDIIGHTLGELLGEDTFTHPIKPFLDRSLAGETIRYEAWFNYAKAGRRFVGVTYAPYVDTDGTISGVVINTRDLTELKHAEQKIVEQAMLLDIATNAIFVRGLDSQILFWNNGATSIYGWSAQEAIGKNATELLYQKPTPKLMHEALKTVVDTGSWQGELAKIDKFGKAIVVSSRWTLVRDEEGKPKSILTVDTDITEQKKLAAQFLRAQRLESIGTLAGGIAHDLNNVLAPILMSVQLLQLKYPKDQDRQLLNLVENNVKRGAALVKQVLSFARGIEGEASGTGEALRTIVQLKHLILEIANIIKETFPKSIELSLNIASDLKTVSADATQLHQVLMNLVVNARDAMPNGGSLSISAANVECDQINAQTSIEAKVGSYVVITVADTGTGIAPEIIERIFDPFFTTKEVGKGTGLGLSTTLGIIKSHDGFLEVCSEVGKNSRFKVYLPTGKSIATPRIETPKPLSGNGELILVVDDEAAICEIAQVALESYNYRVLTANNGIEALTLYAQNKNEINVVLLDMMMPKMDGLTTIHTLQRMNPSILFIATSGLTSSDRINLAIGKGAKAFLPKPYTAQELLKTLQETLER
ncbi:PAS domain S-box protein [Synechocystis sp. PCC 7509]|uniref:PAS domain S-box protein n=1 Tax=Synechocystis sp. PCC 7509 TaxID=927677 RepID=UPI0002ABD319|nr:PAS domain S-box protein [Synechocystis sp. PCC 7509]